MAAQPSTLMIVSLAVRSFVFTCCLLLAPALARAQAEPAPEGYVPPRPLKWRIAADGRVPIVLREPAGLPTAGWGAGAQVTRSLIEVGRIRFGVGADFGYARFANDLVVRQPDFTQHLAHMTFAALFVFDAI